MKKNEPDPDTNSLIRVVSSLLLTVWPLTRALFVFLVVLNATSFPASVINCRLFKETRQTTKGGSAGNEEQLKWRVGKDMGIVEVQLLTFPPFHPMNESGWQSHDQ